MPKEIQSNASPQGSEDGSEDPWHAGGLQRQDMDVLPAASSDGAPGGSPSIAADGEGQADLTVLSLDELLSLSITGDLTELETAGEGAASGGTGLRGPVDGPVGGPVDGEAAIGGAWPGEPERGGQSRPTDDQSGVRLPGSYDGENFDTSLSGLDAHLWLDQMA